MVLDDKLDYKINRLNLKHTVQKYSDAHMNRYKLPNLVKAMSKTNLVERLTDVVVVDKHYDHDDIANLFEKYWFMVEIHN